MRGQSSSSRGNQSTRLVMLLRELNDRVRKLENKSVVYIGQWRIQQDANGDLVAENTETGSRQVLANRIERKEGN